MTNSIASFLKKLRHHFKNRSTLADCALPALKVNNIFLPEIIEYIIWANQHIHETKKSRSRKSKKVSALK